MMNVELPVPWSWSIGSVLLEVRHGSLLEAPEKAWVNSEQTDFILAWGNHSVSAQLNQAWPHAQLELNEQTKGKVLPAGTVLSTSGPDGRIIYHAGFHGPEDWLFGEEDREAVFLDSMRECIEKILDDAVKRNLPSIAFPLIGTGVFGLKTALFAGIFFETVATFAKRVDKTMRVVLCVWEQEKVDEIVRRGTQSLAAMIAGGRQLLREAGGHPLVKELRPLVRKQADDMLQERSLVHFAESALATDLAVAAGFFQSSVENLLLPCAPKAPGINLSFGLIRDRLQYIGNWSTRGLPEWFRDRLHFLKGKQVRQAIGRLVKDRNKWAHHESPRDINAIVDDIENLFGPKTMPEPWPDSTASLWVRKFSEGHGLLYGVDWVRGELSWLVPHSRHWISEPLQMPSES
jgi:O-acetyl-ADP-ribose deacetylase (regulator of RNase III)